MSDWEIVSSDNNSENNRKSSSNSSDWEVINPDQQVLSSQSEGFASALKNAPGIILNDFGQAVNQGISSLPGYYQSAKTEIPGFLQTLLSHPSHLAAQGLAGTQELVNNLAQLPLNLSRYGSERLNLLPKGLTNFIEKITPQDTTNDINQLFGEPKYPGEALIRGIGRNAVNLYGLGKVGQAINPKGLLLSRKDIANSITKKHDLLENRASEGFKKVSDEINNRGISQIPIEEKTIDEIRDFFPKTKQANALLDKARSGDYNSLRKVQSDLYTKGKNSLKSPLESERLRAEEMFEKRDDINQSISNHLHNSGQNDLNEILNKARADYRTLQKVYYHPKINNSIVDLVDSDTRKVPKNLIKILQEESKPMQELRDFHPGLEKNISSYLLKRNSLSYLKKYGVPVGAAALALKYGNPYRGTSNEE